MYKFIKTPDQENRFDHVSIDIHSDSVVTLEELIDMFQDFTSACGFASGPRSGWSYMLSAGNTLKVGASLDFRIHPAEIGRLTIRNK